jgi:eukaryotic-like serine/threonine-protein kinase
VKVILMKRSVRVVIGAAMLVAAGLPQAWAEHEKKPAAPPKPPAGAPNRGLKPPPGKPTGQPRAGSGSMVKLDGGTFTMGSTDGDGAEKPAHRVTLPSFHLDVTEVTVASYKLCVDAGSCSKPDDASVCNWGKSDRDTHPINCVNWEQATEFCKWANKRLPTEEEWEFAARGSEGRLYPWGDAAPGNQLCWDGEGNDLGKGKRKGTCAVGSYPTGDTSTGLKDMAGNLWEWTASQYCPYSKSGYNVSKCDSTRVLRGGSSCTDDASRVRGANRSSDSPWFRLYNFGFRCARTDLSYQLPGLFKFDRASLRRPSAARRLPAAVLHASEVPHRGGLVLSDGVA